MNNSIVGRYSGRESHIKGEPIHRLDIFSLVVVNDALDKGGRKLLEIIVLCGYMDRCALSF